LSRESFGALSNSFVVLMVLNELISNEGEIYKISATLRDSLGHRLKREGYVEGIEVNNRALRRAKNCYADGLPF
jgi:hypothetical protein